MNDWNFRQDNIPNIKKNGFECVFFNVGHRDQNESENLDSVLLIPKKIAQFLLPTWEVYVHLAKKFIYTFGCLYAKFIDLEAFVSINVFELRLENSEKDSVAINRWR